MDLVALGTRRGSVKMSLPDYDTWIEEPFQRRCREEDLDEMDEMDDSISDEDINGSDD